MTRRSAVRTGHVLWGRLSWHPAVAAWRAVAPDTAEPERIEVLHDGPESGVYRLVGAGPDGAPIIARREARLKAQLARHVHEQVLDRLSLGPRRCCGFKPDGPRLAWLFLSDTARTTHA